MEGDMWCPTRLPAEDQLAWIRILQYSWLLDNGDSPLGLWPILAGQVCLLLFGASLTITTLSRASNIIVSFVFYVLVLLGCYTTTINNVHLVAGPARSVNLDDFGIEVLRGISRPIKWLAVHAKLLAMIVVAIGLAAFIFRELILNTHF